MEMNADLKRKPRQRDRILAERARRRQEEALDDALKNTFPASDPVSMNNPLHPVWIMTESVTAKGLMSALGHKRTSQHVRAMSALPPKADIS